MRSSSWADDLVCMRMRVPNDRSARRLSESQRACLAQVAWLQAEHSRWRQQVGTRRRPARTLYSPTGTRCENGASQPCASPWAVNRASGDSARPKANQRPVAVAPPAADAFAHGVWGQRLGLSLNAFDLTRPRALDGASGPFDVLGRSPWLRGRGAAHGVRSQKFVWSTGGARQHNLVLRHHTVTAVRMSVGRAKTVACGRILSIRD